MDKRILEEYIDACEVIKEAEAEIRKLESKKNITANETVFGGHNATLLVKKYEG